VTGDYQHTKNKPVVILKEEKPYFDPPEIGDEVLAQNESVAFLQIVNLAFKKDNKCRFSRGEIMFYADIEDEDFLDRVWRNAERFAKDDLLEVILHTKDILGDKGLRTEYTIKEVVNHRPAARQLPLPIDKQDQEL